jgi:hypothetical protein
MQILSEKRRKLTDLLQVISGKLGNGRSRRSQGGLPDSRNRLLNMRNGRGGSGNERPRNDDRRRSNLVRVHDLARNPCQNGSTSA